MFGNQSEGTPATERGRRVMLLALAVSTAFVALMIAAPNAAAEAPEGKPKPAELTGDFVVDELFTVDGEPLAVKAYARDGSEIQVPRNHVPFTPSLPGNSGAKPDRGGVVANGSGSGGSPGSSGCRSVTVSNEVESAWFGTTLLWWHSQTYWCWDSASKVVYNVDTTEWFSNVDSLWSYKGITYSHEGWYAYLSGYSSSGYYNDKQSHFDSCIGPICQNVYPYNQLWSFYTGAYQWQTTE